MLAESARRMQQLSQKSEGRGILRIREPGGEFFRTRCGVFQKEGAMANLEVSAHMTVRPGCLEGFKKQAAECIRITKEQDTRTLRYDWFLSTDGTECEVREAYTSPEGLIEHNTHILEARTKLFKEYADNHFMTIYGDSSQQLLDLLKKHAVGHTWFTFLKGLNGSGLTTQGSRTRALP